MFRNITNLDYLAEIQSRFKRFDTAKVVAVAQQKGGVGKTTIALNLALVASDPEIGNLKTLVIDQDSSRNLTTRLIDKSEALKYASVLDCYTGDDTKTIVPIKISGNLDLIPAHSDHSSIKYSDAFDVPYRLKQAIEKIKTNYDLIVIDNPGDLDKLVQASLVASDYVLPPLEISDYGVDGITELFNKIRGVQTTANFSLVNLGLLPNEVDINSNDHQEYFEKLKKDVPELLFKKGEVFIHKAVKIGEAANKRVPIWEFTSESHAKKSAKNIIDVFTEVLLSIGE